MVQKDSDLSPYGSTSTAMAKNLNSRSKKLLTQLIICHGNILLFHGILTFLPRVKRAACVPAQDWALTGDKAKASQYLSGLGINHYLCMRVLCSSYMLIANAARFSKTTVLVPERISGTHLQTLGTSYC